MGRIYEISQEEAAEIKAYRKNVKDKYATLYMERYGKTNKNIHHNDINTKL